MSIDLHLDDEVNAITRSTRAVEWMRNFLRLARIWHRQDKAHINHLGDVAHADTGTSDGNAPLLDSTGRLPASLTPEIPASKITSGTFPESQIPNLDASKFTGELSADRINIPVSKLEGQVPLSRIPLSKRPLSGITAVRTKEIPIVARNVVDTAKADQYGSVPLMEITMEQEGSELIFQMQLTYYVKPAPSGGGGGGDGRDSVPFPGSPGEDPDDGHSGPPGMFA